MGVRCGPRGLHPPLAEPRAFPPSPGAEPPGEGALSRPGRAGLWRSWRLVLVASRRPGAGGFWLRQCPFPWRLCAGGRGKRARLGERGMEAARTAPDAHRVGTGSSARWRIRRRGVVRGGVIVRRPHMRRSVGGGVRVGPERVFDRFREEFVAVARLRRIPIEATDITPSLDSIVRSKSLLRRRFRPCQANDLSTFHRCCSGTNFDMRSLWSVISKRTPASLAAC